MTIKTIEIDENQSQMKDLLALVQQGIEVVLAQNNMPLAKLVPLKKAAPLQRVAGLHSGTIEMREDFDEPLDDEFWIGK